MGENYGHARKKYLTKLVAERPALKLAFRISLRILLRRQVPEAIRGSDGLPESLALSQRVAFLQPSGAWLHSLLNTRSSA
jgi:hypothetical protein